MDRLVEGIVKHEASASGRSAPEAIGQERLFPLYTQMRLRKLLLTVILQI
jgi:hypothetical protein